MKNAKRVLVGLLVVAMLVTGLLVSTSADTGALASYTDILKYYDPVTSQVYCDLDFENGSYNAESIKMLDVAKEHTAITVEGEEDKYLSVELGHILNTLALTGVAYTVELPEGRSEVLIRCSVSASHTERYGAYCTECSASYSYDSMDEALLACAYCGAELDNVSAKPPVFNVYLGDTATISDPIIRLDFETGTAYYYNGPDYAIIPDFTPVEDTWYSLEILYLGSSYNVKVSDGTSSYSVEGAISPFFKAYSAGFGVGMADDNRDTAILLDDIYVQAGHEDLYHGVDLVALTDEALGMMENMLTSDATVAEKLAVIDTFDELISKYGERLAKSEQTDATIDRINTSIIEVYSIFVNECSNGINTSNAYEARLKHIETYTELIADVRLLVAEYPDAEVEAGIAAYDAEVAALAATKAAAEKFMAEISAVRSGYGDRGALAAFDNTIFSTDNYAQLKSFVETVEASYTVDSTYTGISETYDLYNVTATRYRLALAKSEAFIALVEIAYNDQNDLNARLTAYSSATSDGGKFTNTSYPGVGDAIAKLDSISGLQEIADVAKRFLNNVGAARASEYLPKTLELIEIAMADYDVVNDEYSGVLEAKATINALIVEVEEKQLAAAAYIAAVDALAGLSGAELLEAIEVALEKQKTGNIIGIDGVTEANIILHSIKTEQEYIQAAADKFIRLVEAIEDAKTLSERSAAINLAIAARDDADDSINGVARAKSQLIAEMSRFDADVAAINGQYADLLTNSADISSVGMAGSDIVYKVISFIKSLVD